MLCAVLVSMSKRQAPDVERRRTVALMGLGMELCVAVVLCGGLGFAADAYFGWYPAGLTVGLVLGMIYGFINFIRTALKLTK